METRSLILAKARFGDWKDMYWNVWSRPETARYMMWRVTDSEEDARARMERTIAWQSGRDVWLVYEKSGGQAIGWAGLEELSPGVWQETGIALGPDFVGRGYGRELLEKLVETARMRGGEKFLCSVRAENAASRGLVRACGFVPAGTERRTGRRDGSIYQLELYQKHLQSEEETRKTNLYAGDTTENTI